MDAFVCCLFALLTVPLSGKLLEVDIAFVGYLYHPINIAAMAYSVAPMEMAVEETNAVFNQSIHFNLDLVYNVHHKNVPQYLDDAHDVAARWYYRKRRPNNVSLSVVVSTCTSLTDT